MEEKVKRKWAFGRLTDNWRPRAILQLWPTPPLPLREKTEKQGTPAIKDPAPHTRHLPSAERLLPSLCALGQEAALTG